MQRDICRESVFRSSAIDLLDRAMASIKIKVEQNGESDKSVLDKEYVKDVVAAMTGLPIGNIQSEEKRETFECRGNTSSASSRSEPRCQKYSGRDL